MTVEKGKQIAVRAGELLGMGAQPRVDSLLVPVPGSIPTPTPNLAPARQRSLSPKGEGSWKANFFVLFLQTENPACNHF